MRRITTPLRTTPLPIVAALIVALVATSVGAGVAARGRLQSADTPTSVDDIALVEHRLGVESAALDVVAARLLASVDVGVDNARLDRSVEELQRAAAALDSLAGADAANSDVAASVLWMVDEPALWEPASGNLQQLFDIAYDVRATESDAGSERAVALLDLGFVGALPAHMLIELVAAFVDIDRAVADVDDDGFIEGLIPAVRRDGGWLGVDPPTTLAASPWFDLTAARSVFPTETVAAETIVADSPLVAMDDWVRDYELSSTAPAFSLSEAVEATDAATSTLRARLNDLIADEMAATAGQPASDRVALGLIALAMLAGVVAFGALVAVARRRIAAARVAHERAGLAALDPLTGVGNRYQLDEITRALASDPTRTHHLIVIVDLDRFKLVNDMLGHAMGDAVLVAIAQGLEHIGADVATSSRSATPTVVRLGGDEFLLTMHAAAPIPIAEVRRRLHELRTRSVELDGRQAELAFSIGLVEAVGPQDLSQLMSAADLALYEEKAQRAAARRDLTDEWASDPAVVSGAGLTES